MSLNRANPEVSFLGRTFVEQRELGFGRSILWLAATFDAGRFGFFYFFLLAIFFNGYVILSSIQRRRGRRGKLEESFSWTASVRQSVNSRVLRRSDETR